MSLASAIADGVELCRRNAGEFSQNSTEGYNSVVECAKSSGCIPQIQAVVHPRPYV